MASVATHRSNGTAVVTVTGDLTGRISDGLLDALWSAARSARRIEVDLSGVTGLDEGGVVALLDAYVATTLRHGVFTVRDMSPLIRRSLERCGVLPVLERVVATAV